MLKELTENLKKYYTIVSYVDKYSDVNEALYSKLCDDKKKVEKVLNLDEWAYIFNDFRENTDMSTGYKMYMGYRYK